MAIMSYAKNCEKCASVVGRGGAQYGCDFGCNNWQCF